MPRASVTGVYRLGCERNLGLLESGPGDHSPKVMLRRAADDREMIAGMGMEAGFSDEGSAAMNRRHGDAKNRTAAARYQAGLAAYERADYVAAIEQLAPLENERGLPATLAKFYLAQSHIHVGIAALRIQDHATASRHFLAARRINPDAKGLPEYLAACHAGCGRFDLAAAEMERGLDAGSRERTLPIRLAHAFVKDGQVDRAVETLTEAIRTQPHRADLPYQLGVILAASDRHAEAETVLRAAARLAPADAAIRLQWGLVLATTGDTVGSLRELSAAQKLRPRDAYAGWLLTLASQAARVAVEPATLSRQELDDNGLDALGEVAAADPEFVEAFLLLPASDVDGSVFGMLAATLERALARHPEYADLHYHCSRVYARLGRTDEAITSAQRATSINPRYVQALIQLGRLYAQTNRSVAAIERLQAAIASGGDYPDVHYLMGELYRQRGQRVEARERYERALELNANFGAARKALALVGVD